MMSNRIKYQTQLEEKVAAALQLLELDEEEKFLGGGIDDNIGRIILRQACEQDCVMLAHIYIENSYRPKIPKSCKSEPRNLTPSPNPLSLLNFSASTAALLRKYGIGVYDVERAMASWGGLAFVLILRRSVARGDESPLGCAVVTIDFSSQADGNERQNLGLLRLFEVVCATHFPRERFMNVLELFATFMDCNLEDGARRKKQLSCPPDPKQRERIFRHFFYGPGACSSDKNGEGSQEEKNPIPAPTQDADGSNGKEVASMVASDGSFCETERRLFRVEEEADEGTPEGAEGTAGAPCVNKRSKRTRVI
mmetsp:Transcript_9580/g.19486  ORF Transcript_9580/g.19486 Transcript_9580/m.19486 type:complete len:309 (-) Transcript_9580:114-1040(-)